LALAFEKGILPNDIDDRFQLTQFTMFCLMVRDPNEFNSDLQSMIQLKYHYLVYSSFFSIFYSRFSFLVSSST